VLRGLINSDEPTTVRPDNLTRIPGRKPNAKTLSTGCRPAGRCDGRCRAQWIGWRPPGGSIIAWRAG